MTLSFQSQVAVTNNIYILSQSDDTYMAILRMHPASTKSWAVIF